MKKIITIRPIEIAVLLIIIVGMFFKREHWPGANELLLLSGLSIILYYLINLRKIKKDKDEALKSLIGITIGLFAFYFVLRVVFWAGSFTFLLLALGLLIVTIALTFMKKKLYMIQLALLAIAFSTSAYLVFIPYHSVFYFVHFKHVEVAEDAPFDYWDRYSRLLYVDGEFERALEANDSARLSFDYCTRPPFNEKNDSIYLIQIESNRKMIESRTWDQYIPFE